MNTFTAYTPLESLLLFQSLATYGAEPSAFSKISDLLKGNPLVRQAKTFDTGRLSPDALRELYLSLLTEDSSGESGRNGAVDATDEGQSNSRKRKLQSPPLPDVTQQAQRLPQLVKKLYARYKENVTKSIREDERRYQALQQEVQEIERGEWSERLPTKGTSRPPTPAHVWENQKAPTILGNQRATTVFENQRAKTPPTNSEATLSDSTLQPWTEKTGEVSSNPNLTREAFAQKEINRHNQGDLPNHESIAEEDKTRRVALPNLRSQQAQGPITASVEQVTKATDQDNSNDRSSGRPKTQPATLLPRSQSSEPRISNYSRHYVTAPPPSRTHPGPSAHPSAPQSIPNEDQNFINNPPSSAIGQASRAEGAPPTSSGPGSNLSQLQRPRQTTTPSTSGLTGQPARPETAASSATLNAPPSPTQQTQTSGTQYRQVMPATVSSRANPPSRLSPLNPNTSGQLLLAPGPRTPGREVNVPQEHANYPASSSPVQAGIFNVPQAPGYSTPVPGNGPPDLRPAESGRESPHVQANTGRNQGTYSPQTVTARPAGRQILPSPSAAQTPVSSISRLQHLFATPSTNRKTPRPPPIDTSLPPSRSFKPLDPTVLPATPGSPVRPGPEDISPISPPSSPVLFPEPTKIEPTKTPRRRGKRAREEDVEETPSRTENIHADEAETRKTRSGRPPSVTRAKARRTRAGSAASSTVHGSTRARSQSFSSHAGEVNTMHDTTSIERQKIKPEQPATPSHPPLDEVTDVGGDTTADESMRLTRDRRKQREDAEEIKSKHFKDTPVDPDIAVDPDMPEPTADPSTGQQYVLSSRNFARTSATIMNDIGSHKYASIFAAPVKERDAPGYKDLIYRPQDLRSIKSAIAAGGKAVAAAVGAINVNPGTPGDSAPSPGPVGTAVAKNTTLLIPISPEVVPPRGIINSAQLEKELMRMFANAIMFNPGPKSGLGNAFKERPEDVDEDEEEVVDEDEEGGVVKDAKEMFSVVEKAVADWRSAERAVENLNGKSVAAGSFPGAAAARARVGAGKEKEEDVTPDEQGGVVDGGGTEEKDDGENTMGTVRKRRRL